ncbi:CBS domain-containing protein [Actinomadura madurae]|uniref:CBS domain-containing protein n=1 Tax=Actinomadura madurae TaxID=1993 RepID=UPI0020274DD8|nr:CBS domain-containing protein [Actinomadura madurae]URN07299.1 CBS domain-containing protein [Actinomadura madurae]
MRARDLAVEYPTVTPESSALDAARLLAGHRLPGLLVVDAENRPVAVIPGSQLLRYTIPHHVRDDPALARVYDERHADQLCSRLAGKHVTDLLAEERMPLPVVDADATAMEIASVMAAARSPVVAVSGEADRTDAPMIGVITASHLLDRLLPTAPPDPA